VGAACDVKDPTCIYSLSGEGEHPDCALCDRKYGRDDKGHWDDEGRGLQDVDTGALSGVAGLGRHAADAAGLDTTGGAISGAGDPPSDPSVTARRSVETAPL